MEANEIEPLITRMDKLIRRTHTEFYRFLSPKINWNNRLVGIKGARGCGKTTLMRQHILKSFGGVTREALYISLDDLWFTTHSLMDLAEWHVQNGGTHLFLDEIHYLKPWQQYLKNIYDCYPDLHIAYTGSSMLQIDYNSADLSRRQRVYDMPGFSFREYLNYELGTDFAAIPLPELLTAHRKISTEISDGMVILRHFKDYLHHGYYPFYKEDVDDYHIRLREVIKLVLEVDLPKIEEVHPATIDKARKMLSILAESVPQTPKIMRLYHELETDRNQGLKILKALTRAGLLQLITCENISLKDMSRPDKIYLDNANLMYALSPSVDYGCLRELFFLNQLRAAGHEVTYPHKGDFLVNNRFLFEIGGAKKGFDQIADIPESYVAADDLEVGRGNKIPLWLFGFLY